MGDLRTMLGAIVLVVVLVAWMALCRSDEVVL
jgi:hypothetical protein